MRPASIVRHLLTAINVAEVAEEYARKRLGRDLKFSPEDIRALGIAGYIQQSRRKA
jgi:hypothetical protein